MRRADSLEKTLMLGKTEGRRRGDRGWDGWMASLIQWTWVCTNSGKQWRTGKPGVLQSMGSQRVGHDCNWTATTDKSGDTCPKGIISYFRVKVQYMYLEFLTDFLDAFTTAASGQEVRSHPGWDMNNTYPQWTPRLQFKHLLNQNWLGFDFPSKITR